MTLDLLDTPLRISWHLDACSLNTAQALAIAARLSEAGVFYVTLEGQPLCHPGIVEVLTQLARDGVQVVLICQGTEAELTAWVPDLPIGRAYLDAASFAADKEFGALNEVFQRVRQAGYDPGLLLVPRHSNVDKILPLLDFGRRFQIPRIKLPNRGVDASFENLLKADLVGPEDLDRLTVALAGKPVADLDLEVHDLFLWEVLCPDRQEGRSEYGGCQAANSLGHIDGNGMLHPCSSWPEPLGSVLDHSLDELWSRPGRYRVRDEIATVPSGCAGCRDYALCFGGCRGLSRLFPEAMGRDLLCRAPRR